MEDDGQHTRISYGNHESGTGQPRYDGDNDDTPFLGPSTRRFTVKRDGTMRYCQKCKFEKPDRTHHCSSCKRCVLKMDHHCPWLNNCVGHKNYKAFFVSPDLRWIVLLILATSENVFDPQWIFIIVIALIFGLCLVPFAIHHALLIKSNKTTIESFEKHKYKMGSGGEVMQSRVLNVFDLGRKQNIAQVLGPVWYLWLVPVRNSIGDGWTFPANEYGKSILCTDDDANSIHSHYTSQYHQRTPSSTSSPRPQDRYDRNYHHHHRRRPSISSALLLTHTQYRQQQEQQEQQDHHLDQQQQHQHHDDSFDLSGGENGHWDIYGNENGNDTDDLDQDHYRRDSDESDFDDDGKNGQVRGSGNRRYHPPAPRRFRRLGTLPAIRNDSDEEAEEYLYDSDEPVTIRFTDHGR
ncbi:palmitoyltransferase for Vac8p [Mortierella sp. NVP85]|nr:palmitoyltransferase for Vac8p [Mortierella sp. NVP85]